MHSGLSGILLRRKWRCGCLVYETGCSVLWVLLSVLVAPEKSLEPLNVACSPHLSLVTPSPALFSTSVFSGCSFTFLSITFLFIPILPISLGKSVHQSPSRWTLVLFSVISSPLIIILTYILLIWFYVLLFLLSHHRIVLVFPFACSLFSKRMF